MQLLVAAAIGLHLDQHRWKDAGDGRRGKDHVVNQLPRVRCVARRYAGDIPDHRATGVQVGGAHQQATALATLGGNLRKQVIVQIIGDLLPQRAGAGDGVATDDLVWPARLREIPGRELGIDLPQHRVVVGPQEGKGCDESAGADAGYDLKLGPVARLGPTRDQTSAEGPIAAAAGN